MSTTNSDKKKAVENECLLSLLRQFPPRHFLKILHPFIILQHPSSRLLKELVEYYYITHIYYMCTWTCKAAREFNCREHFQLIPPFIFSFRVKLPWILFSSDSMVRPPMSASRWVLFTIPIPKMMRVTCCGSEVTRLRFRPLSCSFSNTTLQGGSVGLRTPTETPAVI